MVLEDRNRGGAGMPSLQVEYSKMVTESLVESLLDTGQLGMVTQALMRFQHSVISNALKDKHAKVAIRQVAHYHLARKLAIIQQANLKLSMPVHDNTLASNMLCKQIDALMLDGDEFEGNMEVPWFLYLLLLELGYSSFADLVTEDREPAMIDTVERGRRHGNKVKEKHKLA